MELLAVLWVFGLLAYFAFTTERQRENNLLVLWLLLLLPVFLAPLRLLF